MGLDTLVSSLLLVSDQPRAGKYFYLRDWLNENFHAKIPSRSVIHSTLFNGTEFGESGEFYNSGDRSDFRRGQVKTT